MKKLISVMLSLVMLIMVAMPVNAFAMEWYDGVWYDNITYHYDYSTQTMYIDGTGDMHDAFDRHGDQGEVTTSPFQNTIVKRAIIGEGVTSIGAYAFNKNTALTSVTIPSTMTSIGANAFEGCSALVSVKGSANVNIISDNAFSGCGVLNKFDATLDGTIGANSFINCKALTCVNLGEGLTTISANAFRNDSALANVALPSSLATIGSYAFYATSIKNATIGDKVTSLGGNIFEKCEKLESVEFNSTVTVPSAFVKGCKNLKAITFVNGAIGFGASALEGCTLLKAVTLPNTIENIGNYAFKGCTSLTKVVIPDSVLYLGMNLFENSGVKELYIGAGVSFRNIYTHELIDIMNTFDRATNLQRVEVSPSSKYLKGVDGVLYTDDMEYLLLYPANKSSASFNVPSCVKNIYLDSCKGLRNLKTLTLSDTVEVIDKSAFTGASSLEVANLTSSSLTSINWSAFAECKGLKTVNMSDNVKTIGMGAFSSCVSLTSVNISKGLEIMYNGAFSGCSSLKSITLPERFGPVAENAFANCTSLAKVTFKNKEVLVNINAFKNCNAIRDVYFASSKAEFPEAVSILTTGNDSITNAVKHYSCLTTTHNYSAPVVKTKATTSKAGSYVEACSCGAKRTTTIAAIKSVALSKTSYTYDGKAKKPSVTIKDSNGKAISSKYYTVSYPSGRKNVGKYTYKITFKGNYSGSVSRSFTIAPKSTSISKLTSQKKGFKATWKKQATQTTGYQIQIATDSKFTKGVKSYTVSKNSTTSKSITKLSAKKKYYARIRTYKTVGKTRYYSSWSSVKSITTK